MATDEVAFQFSLGTKCYLITVFSFTKPVYSSDQSVLEIAAEELRTGGLRSSEVQASLQQQEEGTVYAQILHFINLMINFRVPLSAAASVVPNTDQTGGTVATTPTTFQMNANFNSQFSSGAQQHQHQRGIPNGCTLASSSQVNGFHERRDLPFTR